MAPCFIGARVPIGEAQVVSLQSNLESRCTAVKLKFRTLAVVALAMTVALALAAVALGWSGDKVVHNSCGEVNVSFTKAQTGPWWYSINQDSATGPVLFTGTTD